MQDYKSKPQHANPQLRAQCSGQVFPYKTTIYR
ncbi:MAG: Unknown protein [uncultured Thiotrichaceae bacterium]|uniref:Uncharacterized protein n=1 Tax=uncultured Thiotrichaceae bacterium TaxID=298394 RepID=A0A6S6TJI3_9GAMM|nr:MAG: Unknown protein [uncultured Thiotrichaceae bacterium]